jgi:DNA-binding MarR family transcriptional regulator
MNVNALIDAIVRQTTILIAQLATLGGGRAQLAHTANQVFLDLSAALREHGVGSKVIADMFGLALRTYQERVRRLSESQTMRGRSLWEAVLEHLEARGPILRAEVLARFGYDDLGAVRSVLRDLVHNGLVYRTGRGDQTTYRAATSEELRVPGQRSADALRNMVWVALQRAGKASAAELMQALSIDLPRLERALAELRERGLIEGGEAAGGMEYQSQRCVLGYDDPLGWEAAVFDHYQALVIALCTKLRLGQTRAAPNDTVGGSTFGFDVWPGHPEYDNVLGLLRSLRARGSELRKRVSAYNDAHPAPGEKTRVVAYMGQAVIGADAAEAGAELEDEMDDLDDLDEEGGQR